MFFWFTVILYVVCGFCALSTLLSGLLRYRPNDLVFISSALIWLGFIVQLILALTAPLFGNQIKGDALQFWLYAGCAVLIPTIAIVWVFLDREVWGNYVLLLMALASIAIVYRMQSIWG